MSSNAHKSVMLEACIDNLDIQANGCYIDMTLGRGGHTDLILKKLGPQGCVIGIDQDQTAIDYCIKKFISDKRVTIIKNNFCNVQSILRGLKINHVQGILMDLGVSSPQLDNPDRGFSYHNDGLLDMRMDQTQSLTAQTIVNTYSLKELCTIFRNYGEIKNPLSVSSAIIRYRTKFGSITSTLQLVEIIKAALPKKELSKTKHFARCYFQALRIAVNDELNILKKSIELAAQCLDKNGRLAIITFHSLEDKIVIKAFSELSKNKLPKEIPINDSLGQEFKILNIRPIIPDSNELIDNHRARSSRLRILMKC